MNITLSNREEATLLLILAVHGPLRKLPQHDLGFLLQIRLKLKAGMKMPMTDAVQGLDGKFLLSKFSLPSKLKRLFYNGRIYKLQPLNARAFMLIYLPALNQLRQVKTKLQIVPSLQNENWHLENCNTATAIFRKTIQYNML
ncbi:hypothetical protein NC651_019018 [Populus alba x Populus x berolinensis]|nr:hypothetical protein NC651_019018 [Populus alba x Populus x berolinensis]